MMSQGYGPGNGVWPGFSHCKELGNSRLGHAVHLGAVNGPHVVMSEYCLLVHVVSYAHLEQSPVFSLYQPSTPFHGLHCVLQMGSEQTEASDMSNRLQVSSFPVYMKEVAEGSGWHGV
jgi:hypothetical protein